MKRWIIIFKALANGNRLKIIKLLSGGQKLSVGDIASELKISLKATSKHLIQLANLDILEPEGARNHVFYSLNPNLAKDVEKAVKLFV